MASLDPFDREVLEALVGGFQARAGSKPRLQALSEYEVARRAGIVECSFVEYETTSERDQVREALWRLEQEGLIRVSSMSGRYDTFVPTEHVGSPSPEPPPAVATTQAPSAPASPATGVEHRLDEVIHLLRSIDERLRHLEAS